MGDSGLQNETGFTQAIDALKTARRFAQNITDYDEARKYHNALSQSLNKFCDQRGFARKEKPKNPNRGLRFLSGTMIAVK